LYSLEVIGLGFGLMLESELCHFIEARAHSIELEAIGMPDLLLRSLIGQSLSLLKSLKLVKV
jgi:hypothetical protein